MKKIILKIVFVIVLITLVVCVFVLKPSNMSDSIKITTPKDISNKITPVDVANHSTSSDCWLVIEGVVYNVTDFISGHPGGDQILLGCGKDATDIFNSRPSTGTSHSSRARSILGQYQIGVLTN